MTPDKNEVVEWVAWWTGDLPAGAFPGYGCLLKRNEKIYICHDGGPSYCSWGRNNHVLRSYGLMDARRGKDNFKKVMADFPPQPDLPETYGICHRDGWISPLGELYLCRSYDHEFLAERLAVLLGLKLADPHLRAYDDLLLSQGWARLWFNHLEVRHPTKEQVYLLVGLLPRVSDPALARSIECTIRTET